MFCWHKQSAIGRTAHPLLFSGNCSAAVDDGGDDGGVDNDSRGTRRTASSDHSNDECVDWAEDVAALLVMFMPGQEEGNSAADILFGNVNPSGRLPLTFPSTSNAVNMTKEMYPGVIDPKDGVLKALYSEKLEVGYRYYATHGVIPKFPFGHGLS
jgi:beta-glucosidase